MFKSAQNTGFCRYTFDNHFFFARIFIEGPPFAADVECFWGTPKRKELSGSEKNSAFLELPPEVWKQNWFHCGDPRGSDFAKLKDCSDTWLEITGGFL